MKGTVTISVEDFCELLRDKLLFDRIMEATELIKRECDSDYWIYFSYECERALKEMDPKRYAQIIEMKLAAKKTDSLPVDLPDEEASHAG